MVDWELKRYAVVAAPVLPVTFMQTWNELVREDKWKRNFCLFLHIHKRTLA
jgi:hypothetical protein